MVCYQSSVQNNLQECTFQKNEDNSTILHNSQSYPSNKSLSSRCYTLRSREINWITFRKANKNGKRTQIIWYKQRLYASLQKRKIQNMTAAFLYSKCRHMEDWLSLFLTVSISRSDTKALSNSPGAQWVALGLKFPCYWRTRYLARKHHKGLIDHMAAVRV